DILIDAVEYCAGCNPTAVVAIANQVSCTSDDMPNSDASIVLTSVTNGDRYLVVQGTDFGAMTAADAITFTQGDLPLTLLSGLVNPIGSVTYTVRVFNGNDDNCATDVTVVLAERDCAATLSCNCTEYIYLNDEDRDLVHKFTVSNTGLNEIGNPWLSANVIDRPHGLAQDINGNLYIGQANSFGSRVNGPIFKLDAFGNVISNDFLDTPDYGFNFDSKDGVLYTPSTSDGTIEAYDLCTGTLIGSINTRPSPVFSQMWGFYIDEDENNWYAADRNSGSVYKGSLDISLYTTPATNSGMEAFNTGLSGNFAALAAMGITRDNTGHFYIVFNSLEGDAMTTQIRKYDSSGTLLMTIMDTEAAPVTPNSMNMQGGFWGARGITYSPTTNLLYVANFENCVTVFNTSLAEQTSQNIGNPTGGQPKAIGIITECCTSPSNITIDTTLCIANVNIGDELFLQDLLCTEGPVAEGTWSIVDTTGFSFDECNNTITAKQTSGCGTFTLSSDGMGSNQQCGVFKITINVCIELCDISGTVFLDTECPKDEVVNGTGMGIINGEQIYAYLIDDAADTIVAEVAVAVDGTYSLSGITIGTAYDVEISTEDLAVGDPQPNPNTYPAGHGLSGEFDPEDSTFDSTPNGNVDLEPLTADITGVDFGISLIPASIEISGTVFQDTDGDINTVNGTGIGVVDGRTALGVVILRAAVNEIKRLSIVDRHLVELRDRQIV
ncbi:MAG: hypothetical protein AAF738_08575, partial [Bacteroidota bacterium]